jgi:hypothetical protein
MNPDGRWSAFVCSDDSTEPPNVFHVAPLVESGEIKGSPWSVRSGKIRFMWQPRWSTTETCSLRAKMHMDS